MLDVHRLRTIQMQRNPKTLLCLSKLEVPKVGNSGGGGDNSGNSTPSCVSLHNASVGVVQWLATRLLVMQVQFTWGLIFSWAVVNSVL